MDLDSPVTISAANQGSLELMSLLGGGRLRVRGNDNAVIAELVAALGVAVIGLGGADYNGDIAIKNGDGQTVIHLNGRDQSILLFNADGDQMILIDGATGDIKLTGGDAAEDFEIAAGSDLPAGSVMIIGDDGRLRRSQDPYDTRVAGVLSGAGSLRPGIVLGAGSGGPRRPVALAGRAFCWADAKHKPIMVGDLLVSSEMAGHAMKASDRARSFGAVLGKALAPLKEGTGLIPVLITLQ